MELRHLRYFAAVARERGFGRAATVLNLAQPALSRQIKDLEDEVGMELLERTPRGASLTMAGQHFLTGATRVLSATENALTACRQAAVGREGRCLIGVGRIMMALEDVSGAVLRVREELPDAEIDVEEVPAVDQAQRIRDGSLDLGLSLTPDEDGLAHEVWQIVEFTCAMLSVDHPLAHKAELEPKDLDYEPVGYYSPSRAPELCQLFGNALDRAGITSPREFIYTSSHSGLMMVSAGRGWMAAPTAMRVRPLQGLVVIPVKGLDFPVRVDLVWRRHESRPVVLTVLRHLQAIRDERRPDQPAEPPARRGPDGLPPGLELRHLRYFAAVADDGGFGRAGEKLGVTQSSLSRQVGDLEDMLGVTLFDRSARGVVTTDAGRKLRMGSRAVFDELDAMMGATQQAKRGLVGRIVIASVPTVPASRILAALTKACRESQPGVDLMFEEYPTPRQPDALREGLVDVGLCHAYLALDQDPHVAQERLVDDSVDCALVAIDHPLAGHERIQAAELAHEPFLFGERALFAPFYDRVFATLAALGLVPKVDATYDALHMVWSLAAQHKGWTLNFGVQRERPPAGLVAVPIEGLHLPWGLDLLWRRHEVNPVVSKVLDLIREMHPRVPGQDHADIPAPKPRRRELSKA